MRFLLICLLAFILALSPSAHAQSVLGGTLQDCVSKYGTETKVQPNPQAFVKEAYEFHKGGFKISVQLLDSRVATVSYISPKPMEDSEILGLMENHAQGSTWKSSPGDDERERRLGIYRRCLNYYRADRGAFATYMEIGTANSLFIQTAAFKEAISGKSPSLKDL